MISEQLGVVTALVRIGKLTGVFALGTETVAGTESGLRSRSALAAAPLRLFTCRFA